MEKYVITSKTDTGFTIQVYNEFKTTETQIQFVKSKTILNKKEEEIISDIESGLQYATLNENKFTKVEVIVKNDKKSLKTAANDTIEDNLSNL